MFEGNVNNGRNVGVGIPEAQRQQATTGQPGSVLHLARVETLATQYADAQGRLVATLIHRIGGTWYLAPNGENYARTLVALGDGSKLAKNLEEGYIAETTKTNVPKTDEVDVIGSEG